jgi:pimeloyl-ACP methyl ester carboxylesterase
MPPVDIVLLRGLAREAAHWGEFIPLLESQKWVHSVHAIDLLGMGQFYKLTAPLSIAENAEFVISQLPVKKERHRVLVAISLGGMVAVEICQKKPESIDQAFVINSSFSNLSPLQQRLQLSAWKRFVKIGRAQDTLLQELEVLQMVSRRTDKHEEIAKQWVEIAKNDRSGRITFLDN